MSTYYGLKPIVGDQLKYFVHGFNIQGYNGGDTWEDSLGSGQITYVVSSSQVEVKGRRRTFDTLGTAEIGSIDSYALNPRTGSYSMTVWFKADSNDGYIFEKGNQFNLFLTGTNHLVLYVMPQAIHAPYGIAVSGSYGIAHCNVSNNHNGIIFFDADTMQPTYTKWSYSIQHTDPCTYARGMAMDSASFLVIGLYDAWMGWYDADQYKSSVGSRMYRWNYPSGDPLANNVYGYDVDFNDEFVYRANRSNAYNGLTGWICQDRKWGGNYGAAGVSASHINTTTGVCIDKLPLSTGSFVYATSAGWDSIHKLSQDSCSLLMSTGSLGSGQHQFSDPWGIACDQEYIYVADYNNERISIYDKQLRYVNHTQSLNATAVSSRPIGISVTDKHIFYTTADGVYKVVKLDKTTLQISGTIQLMPTKGNGWYSYAPKSIYASGSHVMISNRSDQWRVFRQTEHGNFHEVGNGTHTGTPALDDPWNGCYQEPRFFMPEGATEPTGFIWWSNKDGDGFLKGRWNGWATVGVTESWDGAASKTTNGWHDPRDFDIDWENRWAFVADQNNYRIKKVHVDSMVTLGLTGSGVYKGISQSEAPAAGTGLHEFTNIAGVAISESYVYTCDYTTHRIQRFTKDLEYVDETTNNDPYHIKFDKDTNTFYIFDDGRHIRRFDHEWNQLATYTYAAGQEPKQMISNFPYGVYIDDKFIYNCDLWKNAIILDKEELCWENEIDAYKITMRSKAIDTGSWHSMTYTWDGDDMKLYLDGEYQTSQSTVNFAWNTIPSPDIQNTEPMRFGRWQWYSYAEQFVKTRVGAVLVYGKTLDDGEIRKNYDALKWEFTD